jgi:hypothetical protein
MFRSILAQQQGAGNLGGGVITPPASGFTDDTYWEPSSNPSVDLAYSWNGSEWSHPGATGAEADVFELQVRSSGGNAGWQIGYAPTQLVILLNAGVNTGPGILNVNTINIKTFAGSNLGTQSFAFSSYGSDVTLTVPLGISGDDIYRIQFNTFLRSTGPIIKSVVFS